MGHAADCGAKYALQSVLRVYILSISKLNKAGAQHESDSSPLLWPYEY